MKQRKILLSLITEKNDYQREQATAARREADRLGVQLEIVYADSDPLRQSSQLLDVIFGKGVEKPDIILCAPTGTSMSQVAQAAVSAGIGWVVLNRDADYMTDLRRDAKVPAFIVTTDQTEIGRIQGRQFGVLLPKGGNALYLQLPSGSAASQARTDGMMATKPANVNIRTLRAQWTEDSAFNAVKAWLQLSTSHEAKVSLVAGQNDSLALGARRAFEASMSGAEKEQWMSLPFLGCDACPESGQQWVKQGWLAASVVLPVTAGIALELAVRAVESGSQPAQQTIINPKSFPALESLARK